MATEDFTTYTEVDPNTRITMSSSRVTGASLARNEDAYTYLYKAADYFTGWRMRLETQVTAASGSGAATAIVGVGDTVGGWNSWTSGIHLDWIYDGSYKIRLYNEAAGTTDTSTALSISTSYYVEFRRHGTITKAYIYSNSGYSTLVDTLELTDVVDEAKWTTVFGLVTENNASTETMSLYIDSLELFVFTITEYSDPARILTPTKEHTFETYPNGWSESTPAGTTLEQSTTWKQSGTYSLHIVGKTDGTDDAALSGTFTSATTVVGLLSADVYIHSIADGNYAMLFAMKKASTGALIGAFAKRTGSVYTWGLMYYSAAGVWTSVDSTYRLSLDTRYYAQLVRDEYGGTLFSATLYINGVAVVEADIKDKLNTTYFDTIVAGKFRAVDAYADRYIDNLWFYHGDTLRFCSITDTGDGGMMGAATLLSSHIDQGVNKLFKTATLPSPVWTEEASLDNLPYTTHGGGQFIRNGNTLYYFAIIESYTTGQTGRSKVYKSTDNGGTWSLACTDNTVQFYASLYESGKVLGAGFYRNAETGSAKSSVKFLTYDTATDAFDTPGATLASSEEEAIFSDTFDRANSSDLGSNWTELTGNWSISSNQLTVTPGAGNLVMAFANSTAFPNTFANGFVQVTVVQAVTGTAARGGITIRDDGGGASGNHYYCQVIADGTIQLAKRVSGTPTELARPSWTSQAGDKIALIAYGTYITLLARHSGDSSWTQLSQVSDSAISAAGRSSLLSYAGTAGVTATFNDFLAFGFYAAETDLHRRPSDNALVAIISWAKFAPSFELSKNTYRVSSDNGTTWGSATSLNSLWGYKFGRIKVNPVEGKLWVTGRANKLTTSTLIGQNWVAICDATTYEIENEFRWSFVNNDQELGNSDAIYIAGDYPYLHFMYNSGVAGYFKMRIPGAQDPNRKVILRPISGWTIPRGRKL